MNMIGLDNRPRVKNLFEIIQEWLEYRKLTLRRRLQTSLDKVLARLHILEGLLIAFLNIDEVIEIIRNFDDPSIEMQNRFILSAIQAEAILNIRLRKLAKIEEIEIKKEPTELAKEKEQLEGYLNSIVKFKNLMKKELKQILNNFGDERRSIIIAVKKAQALEEKDLIPNEKVTVLLSKAGWVRCAKGDNIDPQRLNYKPEDNHYLEAIGHSNIKVIFFSKFGKLYSIFIDKLPSARGYGEHITTYIPLTKNDVIIGMEFVSSASEFLLTSEDGKGFIIPTEDLVSNKVTGKNIFDAKDVCGFTPFVQNNKMLLVSILGIAVVREYESFALLKKGKGKTLIKLDKKDKLKYIQPFNLETQEVILSAGKRFIRIDKKNIETYLTDKSSGGGVALPQGFRKITTVEIEDN